MRDDVSAELGGAGADAHLDETGQARRRAGHLRPDAHGSGDRGRQEEAVAEADEDLRNEDGDHLPSRERDVDQHVEQTSHDGERDPPPDQGVDAEARREPGHGEIAGHETERGNEEPHAVFGRCAPQHGHHHVRRAAEKAEERRRAEPRAQRVAEETRACGERGHVGAKTTPSPRRGRKLVRFRQGQRRPGEYRQTENGREDEDRLPAEQGIEDASDQRRRHRHEHDDRGDQPDHRGRVLAVVEIADDRAPDGLSGRGAERLRYARDDEACDARDEDGRGAGDGRQRQPCEHDPPAAEAVGQRSEYELRHGKPQKIERDGELDARRVGGELGHQAGDRRHQDIERQRAHAGHGDQQRQQAPRRAARRACGRVPGGRIEQGMRGHINSVHQ